MSKNKHMTLDDRYAIEHGLNDRQSFKKIGFAYSTPLPLNLEGWGFLLLHFPA